MTGGGAGGLADVMERWGWRRFHLVRGVEKGAGLENEVGGAYPGPSPPLLVLSLVNPSSKELLPASAPYLFLTCSWKQVYVT